MTTATFRVSTEILQRLGEELITSIDQGVIELVKNSYDADALKCAVELKNVDRPGGTVVITDDGYGMSSDDIRDGWLILGRSRKIPSERTPRHRLPAGSKGLGRLGALRMGEEVLLVTRPTEEEGSEYKVRIRWSDFARYEVVEDVEFEIEHSESNRQPGTHIEIRRLHNRINPREVQRLAREMILLSDPFGDPTGFSPMLVAPEFAELENLVGKAYFDDCELRLEAKLDKKGQASAKVIDRSGVVRWESDGLGLEECYRAPEATFELWIFLMSGALFVGRSATLGEVRSWLRQVGGVHLYHRDLRVRPYGDPGHDWLSMDLARVRDPELRPSTNTSVGRVIVLDENEVLLQKTDRTGFVENDAFRELRRFATDVLDWMQKERLAAREASRESKKRKSESQSKRSRANLAEAIQSLPQGARQPVEKAAEELESARESESVIIREELGLYKTLASVGTAVSVFAHEIEGPASSMIASIKAVERRARKALGPKYDLTIGSQIEATKQSGNLLSRFATLPLFMLQRSKRRPDILDVNEVVAETVQLFRPYLEDARVETILEFDDGKPRVTGSVAAIEAIVSNLITNSVKAFKRQGAMTDRRLLIRTKSSSGHVLICVLDSGPGIDSRPIDRIWLPGVTSDEDGAGLGLTIVRDTVNELGGQTNAVARGELGGAEIIVQLPLNESQP